ncbi:MAG: formate dehydrogenase accessory protein FdhE [Bryobacteraceae bacterium]|jgi:FdhE protein
MNAFDERIARADELASRSSAAADALRFYSHLAQFQKRVFEELNAYGETDASVLVRYFPALLEMVRSSAPTTLAGFSEADLTTELILAEWTGTPPESEHARFFARAVVQPFAESLAMRGTVATESTPSTCPFCSAKPVVAVLRGEGGGGKRWLLCCMCATEWAFRRLVCPNCGEEDKTRLPVYTTPEFKHVRVEACDSCRTYIKAVDLTVDGHAVPVVDEIASIALNIWAAEHDYSKLESNILGM